MESSSSWKCGRRNATARYTPGLPGTSTTSTRYSRRGRLAFVSKEALSSDTTYADIQRLRKVSISSRD